jgi:nicotinamide-nucleotide amidase
MNAEIIAIGSELLLGQIIDSNSAWIAQRLAENGINLFYKTVVGDNPERMKEIITKSIERSEIVITTGGIGPTQDDLTREMVASCTERNVVLHKESLEELEKRFRKRGFILTKNNEKQATIPENAIVIKNPNGTAPAFIVEYNNTSIISVPGVPFEMKWLIENEIIPYLRNKYDLKETIHYRVLKVSDLGESNVDHLIGEIIKNSSNPTVGVLAHPGQVDVRITAKAKDQNSAMTLIKPIEKEIRQLLGDNIFGVDEDTLENIVGNLLEKFNLTISTCEDISGGTISSTFQATHKDLFNQGLVLNDKNSYEIINKFLKTETSNTSPKELAIAMAKLAKTLSGSDLGLALHGVEEEGIKTQNLGKGETYIAIVGNKFEEIKHIRSAGRGIPDKKRASMYALSMVKQIISKHFP